MYKQIKKMNAQKMKEKKGKKGKKSLRDVSNLVVKRSTRLAGLFKSSTFAANINSISTTSDLDLPPNFYVINDGINICALVGEYKTNTVDIPNGGGNAYPIAYYPSTNLFSIGNDGWYCYSEKKNWSNISNIVGDVTRVTGYLFLFFSNKYNASICSNCYKSVYNYPSLCVTIDSNQGTIFGVVISSISQINALDAQTEFENWGADQSNGFYLSNAINNAITSGNEKLINVINDISSSTGDIWVIQNPIKTIGNNYNLELTKDMLKESGYIYKKNAIINIINKQFTNGNGSGIFTSFKLMNIKIGDGTYDCGEGGRQCVYFDNNPAVISNNIIVKQPRWDQQQDLRLLDGLSFTFQFTQPYYEYKSIGYQSKTFSVNCIGDTWFIENPIAVITNDYIDIDLSNVNETSGDGNNLFAYKDFDISKLIKRENFVNNMGSIEFTEFMLTRYTSEFNATFVFPRGGESTILGSLDQLDKSNVDKSNGGLGFIRVRRDIFGFGSLFGGGTTGSFTLGFTQPYFETQGQAYTSKILSIKFRVIFK